MEPQALLEKVNQRYAGVASLRAAFVQREKVALMGRTRESKGVLYLKRPGKMRWEYSSPEQQTMIADGGTLWLYYPGDKTVYKLAFAREDLSRTPMAAVFWGQRDVQEYFTAIEAAPAGGGLVRLGLKPRQPAPEVTAVSLLVREDDGSVTGTSFSDAFGNRTEIFFDQVAEGAGLDDSLFVFSVPPGTRVLTSRERAIQ